MRFLLDNWWRQLVRKCLTKMVLRWRIDNPPQSEAITNRYRYASDNYAGIFSGWWSKQPSDR